MARKRMGENMSIVRVVSGSCWQDRTLVNIKVPSNICCLEVQQCQSKTAACLTGTCVACQGNVQALSVQLPAGAPPGLAWLEVQKGALLSAPQPLILLPDPCLAEEVQRLLTHSASGCKDADASQSSSIHGPAVDLGLALQAHYAGLLAGGVTPATVATIADRCNCSQLQSWCTKSSCLPFSAAIEQVFACLPQIGSPAPMRPTPEVECLLVHGLHSSWLPAWFECIFSRWCKQQKDEGVTCMPRLLPCACDAGAAQLITLLLDLSAAAAAASGNGPILPAPFGALAPGHLSLLHRSVRSGSQSSVIALLQWSHLHGVHMQVCLAAITRLSIYPVSFDLAFMLFPPVSLDWQFFNQHYWHLG